MTPMVWEVLEYRLWPRWVVRASTSDALHLAWEDDHRLIFNGNTFEYRVTPALRTQGHWEIGRIERQPRRQKK